MRVCVHTHTRSENSCASVTSLLSPCGSWGLNWVIRFGGKQLYCLSLSASTFCVLLLDELPIKLSLQDLSTSNHWTGTSGAMLAIGVEMVYFTPGWRKGFQPSPHGCEGTVAIP